MTPAASALVSDILADNAARALTFGLDSPLVTRGWAAVKTGTSKDLRDNWCIGFTERYTVGVWVGNASGAPMHQVSGSSGAAPVWAAMARLLQADLPSRPPALPGDVLRVATASGPAELYIAGTQPQGAARPMTVAELSARLESGISNPAEGSIHALDPDMPPATQRLVFEGEAGTWRLDGRVIGQGRRVSWAPWPGRHLLQLTLADGRVIERRFEVRGALPKAPAPPGRRVAGLPSDTSAAAPR